MTAPTTQRLRRPRTPGEWIKGVESAREYLARRQEHLVKPAAQDVNSHQVACLDWALGQLRRPRLKVVLREPREVVAVNVVQFSATGIILRDADGFEVECSYSDLQSITLAADPDVDPDPDIRTLAEIGER